MTLYTASLIVVIEPIGEQSSSYDVQERIVLINSKSVDEASRYAERYGHYYQTALAAGDLAIRTRFCGVRKISRVIGPCTASSGRTTAQRPGEIISMMEGMGCEITCSRYSVNSITDADALAAGDGVEISTFKNDASTHSRTLTQLTDTGQTTSLYTANLIVVAQPIGHTPQSFAIHENVILFQCDSEQEAWEYAVKCARDYEEIDSIGLEIGGVPGRMRFCGIRQLCNVSGISFDSSGQPSSLKVEDVLKLQGKCGCEVLYSLFYVSSLEHAFLMGEGGGVAGIDYES